MADAPVSYLLDKLESLLVKEEQLLTGIRTGARDIRDELDSIKSLLRDTETGEAKHGVRTWVRQAREIAYDIEDVLDEFLLLFEQPRGRGGLPGFLRGGFHFFRNLVPRHRIATQIQELMNQVHSICIRRNMYGLNWVDEGASSNTERDRSHNRHVASLFIEEAELVGIDKPREKLIGWLVNGDPKLKVVSVVGMGGSGKTTLVRKVYDNERVKGWFSCQAWLTVTRSFSIEDLLKSIIRQFSEEGFEPRPEEMDTMEDIQLTEILRSYLRNKRYVVVFDDVWNITAWDGLKHALPNSNCGSRILVTTRIGDVGSSCLESSGHIYHLQRLSPEAAWRLFCKKAFRSFPREGSTPPPELEGLSHDIVRICDGLPLAIVAIGGLLSKKEKTVAEWSTLRYNLHSELANNPKLEHIKRILLLSYNDLPYHLKSCFLYFSVFPKAHIVKRITLIRLWIAEGFIEGEEGVTMEKVAESYLSDLIDRSMVQVAESYDYGRVRSCRVHDLIHEVIIMKSKEENFSTALVRRNTKFQRKIRRLSVHNISDDVGPNVSLTHLRAFFVFGPDALSSTSTHSLFSGFRLLKVLDLEGTLIERLPREFGELRHLKYLSLRSTRVNKIPCSIGKLRNLETLDLKETYVTELPKAILRLQCLRHLLACHYHNGRHPPFYKAYGVKVPKGVGSLRELQKLSYVDAGEDRGIIRELGSLTQLKRLGIVRLRTEDGRNLCTSLEKMNHLCSLSVTSIGVEELLDLKYLSSPPPIQRLYLRGPLQTLPHWVVSLHNLVRMRVRWSRLRDDSIQALQALPNLAELTLIRAYDGTEFCSGRGGFRRLKILDLEGLEKLKFVIVDGAMPNLRKMIIRKCENLQTVPVGIEELANLKELHLFDMPELFVGRLRRNGGEERPRVEHIPMIRCYDKQDRVYEEL